MRNDQYFKEVLKKYEVESETFMDLLGDYSDAFANHLFEKLKELEKAKNQLQNDLLRMDKIKNDIQENLSKKESTDKSIEDTRNQYNIDNITKEFFILKSVEKIHHQLKQNNNLLLSAYKDDLTKLRRRVEIYQQLVEILQEAINVLVKEVISGGESVAYEIELDNE